MTLRFYSVFSLGLAGGLAGCATAPEPAPVAQVAPPAAVVPASAPPQAPSAGLVVTPASHPADLPPPAAENGSWGLWSQHLQAWGEPMLRSMEQYCPPEAPASKTQETRP